MARRVGVSTLAPDPGVIADAVRVLRGGGIVAYATDTLYGLAVDPRSDAAVARLLAAKGRPPASPIPLIAASVEQAEGAAALGASELRLAQAFWPGPLSLVAPARVTVSPVVLAGGSTVAIRVPDHQVARALALAHGFCITATSANISGSPAPASADALDPVLSSRIDLVLDAGEAPGGPPSTLVTFVNGRPALLRAGAVAWERVLRSLE